MLPVITIPLLVEAAETFVGGYMLGKKVCDVVNKR